MLRYFVVLSLTTTLFLACYDTPYVQGERIYQKQCQNCHMEDGSGLESLIKPLNVSSLLDKDKIVCVIHYGIKDTIRSGSEFLPKEMPSFNKLTPVEMTNLVNYINSKWSSKFKEKTILEIQNALATCNNVESNKPIQ